MNRIFVRAAAALVSTSGFGGPTCTAPKDKWMKEADFKARVEAQGYKTRTFKFIKANCYEIYGFDKDGKKVEGYFDSETGTELERK
jgi:hypothetical protein